MPKTAVFPPGAGPTLAPYSPGTSADGIVYVSGTLALDKEFNVVHVGDAAKQTEFVLEQIKAVIEAAGGTMADVTFNHIFLTDWANYGAVNGVYGKYFPGDKPARYCIQCGLVKPNALVVGDDAIARLERGELRRPVAGGAAQARREQDGLALALVNVPKAHFLPMCATEAISTRALGFTRPH